MKIKKFNESNDWKESDLPIEPYDLFVDESNPDNILYFELRETIDHDDAREYNIWTPKGNIEVMVINRNEFESFEQSDLVRLGDESESVKAHFLAQFEDDEDDLDISSMSLEEKMLRMKLKIHGETLTFGQMEAVVDAMKEVTTQRNMGNKSNNIQ